MSLGLLLTVGWNPKTLKPNHYRTEEAIIASATGGWQYGVYSRPYCPDSNFAFLKSCQFSTSQFNGSVVYYLRYLEKGYHYQKYF